LLKKNGREVDHVKPRGLIVYRFFRVAVFLVLFRSTAFLDFGVALETALDPPLLVLTPVGLAEVDLMAERLCVGDHSYLQRLQLQRFASKV